MTWPPHTGQKLLLLLVAVTLFLEHSAAAAADGAATRRMALPGCPDKRGDTIIPYPFGTKDGCIREGFNVTCNLQDQAAYLGRANRSLMVLGIDLAQGEALVQGRSQGQLSSGFASALVRKRITVRCINDTQVQNPYFRLFSPYLTVSNAKNRFTAIGCATIAIIEDINECDNPSMYPCKGTQCHNTDGDYTCSCKQGTHSDDPKNIPCAGSTSSKMVIGISLFSIFVIVCTSILLNVCQKRKLAKEKERFFKQNGGQILYQQILSKKVDTVMIFTLEDLKKATSNFDKSRELGKGGQGIVYKGILSDNKVVAVKRSKIVNVSSKSEEFVHEIIILSQINHKNVVRLLGCCLEVEVPILVYEFIPNGTLSNFIHSNLDTTPISLEVRLRIAQESAEALAYLHLAINNPIVHGDVKSLNILLDENCMPKVADFGASRMLPKDAVQFVTMVQGTWGYLDPEYFRERQLTEKSDVYSFGVVLLELITRKKAIYYEGPEEEKSLASSFLRALKNKRGANSLNATKI